MSDFGFCVRRARDYETNEPTGWAVRLPRQCDDWDIVGEFSRGEPDHAAAVAEFERFLAEGARALEALRAEREFGEDM